MRIGVVSNCQKLGIILAIKWLKNRCYQKMSITRNVLLNWYFSMKDYFWNKKLTLKLWHFLTPPHSPHYTNSQNSIVFFGYVESYAEIFLICTPCLKTRQPVLPYFTFIIHNCSRLKTRLLLIWLNSHQPRTRGHVEHL